MTHDETNNNPDTNLDASARDLLISRVIDGSADPEDWSSFRALAAQDPAIWSELSSAQRDHEALRESIHALEAIAQRVDLPGGSGSPHVIERRFDLVARWGGWAAAAVILIGWFTGLGPVGGAHQPTGNGPMTGSMVPSLKGATPEQAFDQYIESGREDGRVVAELPDQLVVETRPLEDGTIEVIYLRQIIERKVLDKAYREVTDEFGNRYTIPVRVDSVVRDSSF